MVFSAPGYLYAPLSLEDFISYDHADMSLIRSIDRSVLSGDWNSFSYVECDP